MALSGGDQIKYTWEKVLGRDQLWPKAMLSSELLTDQREFLAVSRFRFLTDSSNSTLIEPIDLTLPQYFLDFDRQQLEELVGLASLRTQVDEARGRYIRYEAELDRRRAGQTLDYLQEQKLRTEVASSRYKNDPYHVQYPFTEEKSIVKGNDWEKIEGFDGGDIGRLSSRLVWKGTAQYVQEEYEFVYKAPFLDNATGEILREESLSMHWSDYATSKQMNVVFTFFQNGNSEMRFSTSGLSYTILFSPQGQKLSVKKDA